MNAPRSARALVVAAVVACGAQACARDALPAPDAELTFARPGAAPVRLSQRALAAAAGVETWAAFDPYYGRVKRWRAMPLARVLGAGFGDAGAIAGEEVLLRARDGYTVPLAGERLLEPGAYVAVEDADAKAWEPIGPQRADPGPFYLVWRGDAQQDLATHPRPWQLATLEIARVEDAFPHAVPRGVARDAPAGRGFALFHARCIRCHAMNREGGRVGPDLNVPRSIVEYRPEGEIRAYIADPRAFRYGNMPAHPDLTPSDLDALLAYFVAMKDQKHDPDAAKGAPP